METAADNTLPFLEMNIKCERDKVGSLTNLGGGGNVLHNARVGMPI